MIALSEASRAGLFRHRQLVSYIVAGLIVGILALPFAPAFAIAPGAQPEQCICTSIIAGLIVATRRGVSEFDVMASRSRPRIIAEGGRGSRTSQSYRGRVCSDRSGFFRSAIGIPPDMRLQRAPASFEWTFASHGGGAGRLRVHSLTANPASSQNAPTKNPAATSVV